MRRPEKVPGGCGVVRAVRPQLPAGASLEEYSKRLRGRVAGVVLALPRNGRKPFVVAQEPRCRELTLLGDNWGHNWGHTPYTTIWFLLG